MKVSSLKPMRNTGKKNIYKNIRIKSKIINKKFVRFMVKVLISWDILR